MIIEEYKTLNDLIGKFIELSPEFPEEKKFSYPNRCVNQKTSQVDSKPK